MADSNLKIAYRVANGAVVTNHRTGQKIGILHTAIVRIKPYLTEIELYLGTPAQVAETFRVLKRTFQLESAKAHRVDN